MRATTRVIHRLAHPFTASSASSSAPSTRASESSTSQTSTTTRFIQAFVAVVTLRACDAALDDYVVYRIAIELAKQRSGLTSDARLTEALGTTLDADGAWWNASVSRRDDGALARVDFGLVGDKASCDARVTMVRRDAGTARSWTGRWMRWATPASARDALGGTRAWRALEVEASIPTAKGGGRSAQVSLMRAEDADATS